MKQHTLLFLFVAIFAFAMMGGCRPSPAPPPTPTLLPPTPYSPPSLTPTLLPPTPSSNATITPTSTSTPSIPSELLPHPLYYLGRDENTGTAAVFQVFRMERDGKTIMHLTSEPNGVDGYDISLVDGTLAFVADNQLLLVNTDGSNRRLLVDGGSDRNENNPRLFKNPLSNPVFSPDGQTIAYSLGGLNLYDIPTSVSELVIEHQRTGLGFPIETYLPIRYSPDGMKLLVAMGQWEAPPATVVYYPDTDALVRIEEQQDGLSCCSQHGGPVWSSDSSSFYGVAIPLTFCCQTGELWKVDAGNGAVTRSFKISFDRGGTFYLPKELYLAPNGYSYFFFGMYQNDSGFWDAPVLNMVRSAADGETDRITLGDENFVLMNEALWAPDASLVIVSMTPSRDWNRDQPGGVLELYYTEAQKSMVWLAPSGYQMKWGP